MPHGAGERRILDGVTLALYPGEVVGLVGESGSGKSLTALAVMGLLPRAARLRGGHVWYAGRDLLALPAREWRTVRGAQIAMVFQNPRAALNPLMRAGNQVARVVRLHRGLSRPPPTTRRWNYCSEWASPTRGRAPAPIRTSSAAAWPSAC